MAVTLKSAKQDLQTRPFIFAAYSAFTNLPYVTCDPETYNDQAWLFFREQDIQEFGKSKAGEKILIVAVKFERKNFTQLYGQLYAIGVNEIVWNKAGQKLKIDLREIARQPDLSKIEESKRPLLNPSLQLSGIYFLQEMRRPVPMEEHGDVQELEEEFLVNLSKAQYLLPFLPDEKDPQKLLIPFVKLKDEKNYRPVCTDALEMQRFAGKARMGIAKVPFTDLKKALPDEADGLVINPRGLNMVLPREQLENLLESLTEE